MGVITSAFAQAWRDFNTDGVSSSGPFKPIKAAIRAIGATIDLVLNGMGQPGPADYATTAAEGILNTGSNVMVRRGNDAAASTNIDPMVYWQNVEGPNSDKLIQTQIGMPARSYVTGLPFAGAKLYSYVTGTTTPLAVYKDAACTIPHPQPVISDASGQFPKLFSPEGTYRIKITTSADALIHQQDNVVPSPPLRRPFYMVNVRRPDSSGFSQSAYVHTEEYGTSDTVQSVSFGAAMHLTGAGAGWGGYFVAITRNVANRAVGLEVDVGNSSTGEQTYNPSDPVGETVPHSKGIWTYLLAGYNASIAEGVGSAAGVQWYVGKYYAAGSIRQYLMDIQASPPVGLYFRNGATVNGLGVTQGGVAIDFGPNAKGYGSGPDQGAVHYHAHARLFGASVSDGGSGTNYWKSTSSGNRDSIFFAGVEAWRFTATSIAPAADATGVIGSPTEGLLKLYLSSAGAVRVGSNDVLGSRKTGWTADTGTAKRTANATYSATAEASYTQATIQALMNAVRDLSQTVKALKDDAISHGFIGT